MPPNNLVFELLGYRGVRSRVIILEDDRSQLAMLTVLLESEGYEVEAFSEMGLALRAVAPRDGVRLLVADYWIGDRTSAPVVQRAQAQEIPVLVVSGTAEEDMLELLEPPDLFLRKPVDVAWFLQLVGKLVRSNGNAPA